MSEKIEKNTIHTADVKIKIKLHFLPFYIY